MVREISEILVRTLSNALSSSAVKAVDSMALRERCMISMGLEWSSGGERVGSSLVSVSVSPGEESERLNGAEDARESNGRWKVG